jgi:hypothetical protein
MTNTIRKRGRPKGTGLDDTTSLHRIADIIAANPAIKRTSAIKKIGVTNPSIVRRLRDKFAEEETALMADARRRLASQTTSATTANHGSKVNGAAPQAPRFDGLAFVAAAAANARAKGGKPLQAQALANTSGQSKKTGPAASSTTAGPSSTQQSAKAPRPLPGITALFTLDDVTPLQVAEDIITIRKAVLASTAPLELVITLLKGVDFEQIVTQGLNILVGAQGGQKDGQKTDVASIISLIAGQAKMMDVILPLLAQFASAQAPAQTTSAQTAKQAAGKKAA